MSSTATAHVNELTGEVLEVAGNPLAVKIARIAASVKSRVIKDGRNNFHNYDYATESAILESVRQAQAEQNVAIVPDVLPDSMSMQPVGDKGEILTTLMVRFTVIDGDSGVQHVGHMPGAGTDKLDKGAYKAVTGASKQFLQKLYQLPTGKGENATDPEQGSHAERQERPRQQIGQRPAATPPAAATNSPRPLGAPAASQPAAQTSTPSRPAASSGPRPLGQAPTPASAPVNPAAPIAAAPVTAADAEPSVGLKSVSVRNTGNRPNSGVPYTVYAVITDVDQKLAAFDAVGEGLQTACVNHQRVVLETESTQYGPKIIGFRVSR